MSSGPLFAAVVASAAITNAAVRVEKINYKGWPNCYRISNGEIEAVVTGDVGPRVIRLGFVGGQNLFKEFSDQIGKTGEPAFQLRGGHRLWKAPEDPVASWAPDNVPVEITVTKSGVVAMEPVEPLTKLQKEIAVEMADTGTSLTVRHRLINHGLFPLEYSAWGLTMMAPGGTAITGFPPRGKHPQQLEATNPLVMWAYTDLSDPRWKFTRKYMMLRQDPANAEAQKLGLFNRKTWVAYVLNGEMFLKQTVADPALPYPDFGCSFETFTNNEFLEIETLSPLTKVPPAGSVSHVEHWSVHRGISLPGFTEAELDRVIQPLLR
ncbi:MAG TPA: hypothetical protein VLW65_26030 [Bryobacteraceae bacterium]|nr:hypothetical protein [Bryobacteraceae bacterium]